MSITRNKLIYLGMIIISVILIIHSSLALINYMLSYKYEIDHNFDHSDFMDTYKSRKIEIEIILLYTKLFIGYFSIITIYFIHKIYKKKDTINTSGNKPIYLGIIFLSILFIALRAFEVINYMLNYKYQIDQNFDQADLTITYKTRKFEIGIILFGLKVFIGYIFIFTIYFIHKLFQKNNTK